MPEPVPAPTEPIEKTDEPTPAPEPVKDAEAVLAKNKELLAKLAEAKKAADAAAAKVAEFEAKEADAEIKRLEKKGEYEKAVDARLAEKDKVITEKDKRYDTLFNQYADKELQLAIPPDVFDAMREDFSIVLRNKYLKPVEDDGKLVWKSLDGLETIDLATFLPSLKAAHGGYFKADNNPGGDAPGNNGNTKPGGKWDKLTRDERSAAIRKAGGDIEAAKRLYK